ncbi:MAG TPA: chloramphenicol acetyltransferase [Pyrinomonadaceae bacterium]|jgi:chloramphenicol O-acetyltransferase type A|nr:chloramphenicol acetyltransferase [Pyrinomonadaceae bacterium]
MKLVDIENWNRKTIYEYFKDFPDPFFNLTANLDVTQLYRFCKEKKLSFSLANLFYSLETVNQIREFRMRLKDDRLVEFERIHATMTIAQPDETFSFCYFEMQENIFDFNEAGKAAVENYTRLKTFDVMRDRVDLIYSSVIPWVSFTSFKHASRLNNKFTIPRMVWGKMFDDAGKKKLPHSVEVNHAIADGFHVGKYFVSLQEKLSDLGFGI